MTAGEIVWSIFITVLFLLPVILRSKLGPFMRDYRFTEEGIEFVKFGGRRRMFCIKRDDIQDAAVMSGLLARLQNPFARNMSNRWTGKVLLIRTTRGASYMLTPANPEKALKVIGNIGRAESQR